MQIVINENSYTVPTAWNEIPLGRFMDYMAQYEEEATADRKQLVLVSTLTGAPKPLLEKAKKNVIDQAVEELNKIMSREASKQLNLIIEIDGIEYGFHPNLHELRLKEFVDLDNKLKVINYSYMDVTRAKEIYFNK